MSKSHTSRNDHSRTVSAVDPDMHAQYMRAARKCSMWEENRTLLMLVQRLPDAHQDGGPDPYPRCRS